MPLLWILVISYLGYPHNDSLYLHFQQRLSESAWSSPCGSLLKDPWGLLDALRRKPRSFSRSFNAPYNLTQIACVYHLSLPFQDPGIQLSLPQPSTFTSPCNCSCSSLCPLLSALVVLLKFKCHSLLEPFLSSFPPLKWWIIFSSG